jgi:hypothetical protein
MRREELLSLRLHEAVADKLRTSPQLVDKVKERLLKLSQMGQLHPHYQEAWQHWLTLDLKAQLLTLTSVEEVWIDMRQASPFAGFLSQHERLEVLRRFKHEWAERCEG